MEKAKGLSDLDRVLANLNKKIDEQFEDIFLKIGNINSELKENLKRQEGQNAKI